MKIYSIPFFADKKQSEKPIKVNENIAEVYYGLMPEGLKDLLSSTFNARYSRVDISEKGVKCSWHTEFVDFNRNHCIDAPNYVTLDMMTEQTKKVFTPQVKEFSAPAIGEEFYLWEDGEIFKVKMDSYSVEIDSNGGGYYHITFEGEHGKRAGHVAESQKEMNRWIETYCKKSPDQFDSKFWMKQYKSLKTNMQQEYDELKHDYDNYKSFY